MLGLGRQFYASLNTGLFGELEHLKIKGEVKTEPNRREVCECDG
jgi:hypothetical protein